MLGHRFYILLFVSKQCLSEVTLGGDGAGSLFLAYSDSDSLRVTSLGIPGLEGTYPIWAGPGGSASGRGLPQQFKEEVSPDETIAPDALYLYPNPASDLCTIRAEGFRGTLIVHAYTAGGTHLGIVASLFGSRFQSTGVVEQVWNVSRLAPGIYHLVVEQLDSSHLTNQKNTIIVQTMTDDFKTTLINQFHQLIAHLTLSWEKIPENEIDYLSISSPNNLRIVMSKFEISTLKNLVIISENLTELSLLVLMGNIKLDISKYFEKIG